MVTWSQSSYLPRHNGAHGQPWRLQPPPHRGLNSPNYRSSRVVRLKKLPKAESSKGDTRFEKVTDVTEKWSSGDGDVVADNKKPRQRPY